MENIKKNSFKTYLLLASCTLLAVCSVFFPLLLLAVPAFIAAVIAKSEKASLSIAIAAAIPALTLYLIFGAGTELLCLLPLAAAAVGSGIMIYALQKKKNGGFDTVFYTALLTGGCLYLSITLPGLLSGQGAFALVKEAAVTATEVLKQAAASLPVKNNALFTPASFESIFESMPDIIVMCVVPYCCLAGGGLAFFNLLFFRLFIKKQREALGFAPLRRFSMWSVPRSYVFGTFLLFVGSFVLDLMEFESADPVMLVAVTLFICPLLVQGLCFVDWLIDKRCRKEKLRKTRILVYILIVLFFRFASTTLTFVGAIEQFMRIRERVIVITRPGGPAPKSPFTRRGSDPDGKDPEDGSEQNKTEEK